MKIWTIAGIITSLVVLSLITRKCRCDSDDQKHLDQLYNIDDLISDQEI